MIIEDAPAFERLVIEMADCFNQRQPSGAALKHWFSGCREFTLSVVQAAGTRWLQSKAKAPTIADFRSLCVDARADEIEERQRELNRSKPDFGPMLSAANKTEAGCKASAAILAFLRRPKGPRDMNRWARDIVAAHERGENVTDTQITMARQALNRGLPATVRERVPGEDDEAA